MGDCLEQGRRAASSRDTRTLRKALQQKEEIGLSDSAVDGEAAEWREELKTANLMVFNMKALTRRFARNADFKLALRLLKSSVARPLKAAMLQKAVAKAQSAEMAEEDYELARQLLEKVTSALQQLEEGLGESQLGHSSSSISMNTTMSTGGGSPTARSPTARGPPRSLSSVALGFHAAIELDLHDPLVDRCRHEIARLASALRRAAQLKDVAELEGRLRNWILPDDRSHPVWGWQEFVDILAAEQARAKLQAQVDEAEKRFAEGRWDALQKKMESLRAADVRVPPEAMERWTSALKRERNFDMLRVMGHAMSELRRKLYKDRLEAALHEKSIPIEQLHSAADVAEQHRVDAALVERARAEAAAVLQRASAAEAAVAKRRVDMAEVQFYKLETSRIRVEAAIRRDGPLWELADTLRVALQAQDLPRLEEAVKEWTEDKPDSEHPAFTREESPTRLLRLAKKQLGQLRLRALRDEVNDALDALQEGSEMPEQELKEGLKRVAQLVREMMGLGWELNATRRARLLAVLRLLQPQEQVAPARLGAGVLRLHFSSAVRIVFVLDSSKSAGNLRGYEGVVTLFAQEIANRVKDVQWGLVTYGPKKEHGSTDDKKKRRERHQDEVVKGLELTADLEALRTALAQLKPASSATTASSAQGAAPPAATAKALREALKVLKLQVGQHGDEGGEPLRIVFHLASREPENAKEAQKVFRLLTSNSVLLCGVAVGEGSGIQDATLKEISSPALNFRVGDVGEAETLVRGAFTQADDVLASATESSAEDTLYELESCAD